TVLSSSKLRVADRDTLCASAGASAPAAFAAPLAPLAPRVCGATCGGWLLSAPGTPCTLSPRCESSLVCSLRTTCTPGSKLSRVCSVTVSSSSAETLARTRSAPTIDPSRPSMRREYSCSSCLRYSNCELERLAASSDDAPVSSVPALSTTPTCGGKSPGRPP